MRTFLCLLSLCISGQLFSQFQPKREGEVHVNGKIHRGFVSINADSDAVLLHKDSINHLFQFYVDRVIFKSRFAESYIGVTTDGTQSIYRVLVEDQFQLLERNGIFYARNSENTIVELKNEPKAFYQVFGRKKKNIKEYVFLHDISIEQENGIREVFTYYNSLTP